MLRPAIQDLQSSLRRKAGYLAELEAELATYLQLKQERHEQLTRRYERLERRTDSITNLDTPRSQRLLAEYELLSERHAQSEEELDDCENLVLEPLREARAVLLRLVS